MKGKEKHFVIFSTSKVNNRKDSVVARTMLGLLNQPQNIRRISTLGAPNQNLLRTMSSLKENFVGQKKLSTTDSDHLEMGL